MVEEEAMAVAPLATELVVHVEIKLFNRWSFDGIQISLSTLEEPSCRPVGPDHLRLLLLLPLLRRHTIRKVPHHTVSPIQTLIHPLFPTIKAFKSFPFNGFLVFLTLYFVVVKNPNFGRYVRFNMMQVIMLDALLIFPDLLEMISGFLDGMVLDVVMSLNSTIFLHLWLCLVCGSFACLLG